MEDKTRQMILACNNLCELIKEHYGVIRSKEHYYECLEIMMLAEQLAEKHHNLPVWADIVETAIDNYADFGPIPKVSQDNVIAVNFKGKE